MEKWFKSQWTLAFNFFMGSDCVRLFIILYIIIQVPVRVAGGLLFELSGQSISDPLVGDPLVDENDIPLCFGLGKHKTFW